MVDLKDKADFINVTSSAISTLILLLNFKLALCLSKPFSCRQKIISGSIQLELLM